MDLYDINGGKLNQVDLNSFKLEKEIQNLVEKNTQTLFDLEFVSTEFSVNNFRIDTLCFDEESNSFVIIEYKKGSSYSVIDQGYSYLSIMLNNKSDFILEYNERCDKTLIRDKIDWSQSRIIFISPSFNSYQKNSVNFKDVPFELWEINRYSNNTISLNQIISKSTESINTSTNKGRKNIINKVSEEIKVISEEDHTNKTSDKIIENWRKLKNLILELEGVEILIKKSYISVVFGKKTLCYCNFKTKNIFIEINRGIKKVGGEKSKNFFNIDDPKKLTTTYSWTWKSGDRGNVYKIKFDDKTDLNYLIFLLKQKYESLS